jgi:DNA-binding CsgD family transcriptional regulator
MSAIKDFFEDRIKPHLAVIKELMEEQKTTREICDILKIEIGEWKLVRSHCSEFVTFIESIKGQTSTYYKEVIPHFNEIEDWIIEGFSRNSIARKLNLRPSMLSNYFRLYPQFKEFYLLCESKKNEEVVTSLYKRARGYIFEEKKESIEEGEYIYDAAGQPVHETKDDGTVKTKNNIPIQKRKKGKVKVEKITKEMAPDVSAAQYWLGNQTKDWKRKEAEDDIDPLQIAKDIRDNIKEMNETVPQIPEMTNVEQIMNLLSNMPKEELKSLVPVINRVVDDIS